MAKRHTAGPWIIFIGDDEFLILPALRQGEIAKVRIDADARLIAAAPDLLNPYRAVDDQDWAYLDSVLTNGGRGRFWKAVFAEVRAAITKAEGK